MSQTRNCYSTILLAAGQSLRMGGCDKLLLDYNGKPMLQHAVELLRAITCDERIIVISEERLESLRGLRSLNERQVLSEDIIVAINTKPQNGQSHSIHLGLKKATKDFYLFLNADQPRLKAESLAEMFRLSKDNPEKIIYPTINGCPTSPTLFPKKFAEGLLALRGDMGGRALRDAFLDDCIGFEVAIPDDFLDVDSMDDYRRFESKKL